jgi:hypothetical protein
LSLLSITVCGQPKLNLANADEALKASQKIQCSLEDGKPVLFWWKGSSYSRVAGELDRQLFNVEGLNIRACQAYHDPQRGYGYRLVSREILLYKDPGTDEILRSWQNPWTNQRVEVVHVANDPVNQGPFYANQKFALPATFKNGRFFYSLEIPLFYPNPLGGEYQEYVGGTYHAMEMFNFFGYESELLDGSNSGVERVTLSWSRVSDWLPWMEMGDRQGMLIFSCVGKRLSRWADLPAPMRAEIEKSYPAFTAPPPLDDTRPNETSWTYFKKQKEKSKQSKHP